jgi:hypothetical protein
MYRERAEMMNNSRQSQLEKRKRERGRNIFKLRVQVKGEKEKKEIYRIGAGYW